jgi:hypothetical protein
MRWHERNIEREQRQAELEDEATRLIRAANRPKHKRPAACKSPPPEPLPDKGWIKLADLKRALRQRSQHEAS